MVTRGVTIKRLKDGPTDAVGREPPSTNTAKPLNNHSPKQGGSDKVPRYNAELLARREGEFNGRSAAKHSES